MLCLLMFSRHLVLMLQNFNWFVQLFLSDFLNDLWFVCRSQESLPFVRDALFRSSTTIDGIRPLPASVATVELSLATTATVDHAVPVFSVTSSASNLRPRSVIPNLLAVHPAQVGGRISFLPLWSGWLVHSRLPCLTRENGMLLLCCDINVWSWPLSRFFL